MAPYFSEISSWFWNPDVWLPSNITWGTFSEQEIGKETFESSGKFAKFSDLWYPIPLALLVIIVRMVVERVVFKRVGIWFGMKDYRRHYPSHNTILESSYKKLPAPSRTEVEALSVQCCLTTREVRIGYKTCNLSKQSGGARSCCFRFHVGGQTL